MEYSFLLYGGLLPPITHLGNDIFPSLLLISTGNWCLCVPLYEHLKTHRFPRRPFNSLCTTLEQLPADRFMILFSCLRFFTCWIRGSSCLRFNGSIFERWCRHAHLVYLLCRLCLFWLYFLNSWTSALTVEFYIHCDYILGKPPHIKVLNFSWIIKKVGCILLL